MPTIERDWTSSNYAFIDPDKIKVLIGSGTVTVHGDGRIDIVNNGSSEFRFRTEALYFAEGSYWTEWGNQYATLTVNSEATANLSMLSVSFSDGMYSTSYITWSGGTSATTPSSHTAKLPNMVTCSIMIEVKPNSSITDMELGLVKGQYASAWESAYEPFSEDGWLFVRWLYQNEDGTWPDFTDPYDTETYTLPAGVQPIPEEAFVPDPAKVPSSGEYVLDESQSDTGTVSITAGSTRMAAIYFKLNFEVTYHDGSGSNSDVTTGSLDYGASTPTAPSFTRDGYTLIGWTPEPSATVTQDVTYTARWQVATAQYHVDTYLQSAGSYPGQPSSTIARTGNVGSTVSLTPEDKTPAQGYAYDTGAANVESGVVTIDGALHLKAYFKQQFTVTYNDGVPTAEVFPDQTTGGLDYGVATPEFSGTPTRTGYDFTGWTPEVAGIVTADATYSATWQIQSCPYQIRYMYQVAGSYDTGTAIVETSETRYGNYGFTVQATESDKTPTKPGYVLDTAYPVNGVTLTDKGTTAYVDVHFKQQFTVTYTDGVPDEQVFEDEVHSGLDYYTATWRDRPRPILTIGGKALSDFGECVASRNTGAPEKKTSTVTVPHMSGFWDFSKIYGALAYESREVTYTIELLGDDRADLQDRKSALMAWLLATHDQAIYDDDIKGWHFVGSCSGCEWEEGDEGESGTITATFLCQPFLYADDETSVSVPEGSQVVSNPGEALNPMAAAASGTATVTLGGVTQSVTTTPTRLVGQLVPGDNNVTVSGGTVTLTWYETRI